jgi:hypothetical protein
LVSLIKRGIGKDYTGVSDKADSEIGAAQNDDIRLDQIELPMDAFVAA